MKSMNVIVKRKAFSPNGTQVANEPAGVARKRPVPVDAAPKAFPVDTSPVLARFLEAYAIRKKPIRVSFRNLVSWIKSGERATHYIHPYPAKLLPQIAHFFLAASSFAKADDLVLDPFGGSGTVALETVLSGRNAVYADVNPLARLIAAAKTQRISLEKVAAAHRRISTRFRRYGSSLRPDVVNIDLWYSPATIRDLAKLKRAIEGEPDCPETTFLLATFSAVARKVSRADPRFSVPVRTNKKHRVASKRRPGVWKAFEEQYATNLRRMQRLLGFVPELGKARCILASATNLNDVADGSIDLVITSPPYAGAQKYVRAASLSLGWLGLTASKDLRALEDETIGREHFTKAAIATKQLCGLSGADELIGKIAAKDAIRATIVSAYLREMQVAISQITRKLKSGGHVVLVIGDNFVSGQAFPSSEYVRTLFELAGLTTRLELVDAIHSRGLMTKRNRTAAVINKEHIFVLQKSAL